MVVSIGNEHVANIIKHNARRVLKVSRGGQPSVARVANRSANSHNGDDNVGAQVNLSNTVVEVVSDVEGSLVVMHPVDIVECGQGSKPSITRVALGSCASKDSDSFCQGIHLEDSVIVEVGHIDVEGKIESDSLSAIYSTGRRWADKRGDDACGDVDSPHCIAGVESQVEVRPQGIKGQKRICIVHLSSSGRPTIARVAWSAWTRYELRDESD